MKTKYILFIGYALLAILLQCAIGPLPTYISDKGPTIRVGIVEKQDGISLISDGPIDIFDQYEQEISQGQNAAKWHVSVENATPTNLRYGLLYREVFYPEVAERLVAELKQLGFASITHTVTKHIFREGKFGPVTSYQVLLNTVFDSEPAAKSYQQSIQNKVATTILIFLEKRPAGEIVLTNDATGQRFSSQGFIRIRGNLFTIQVKTGEGYHFEGDAERSYKGQLEFWLDRFGKITVVNILPMEEYLKGVVGSEMHPEFPLEALKAQAVTARGFSLSRIGKQHRLEPFDLCDEVHCHVYGGVKKESPLINEAVAQTRGQVLMFEGAICEAFYAGVCGGHSEHNENVWNGDAQPFLRGVFDSPYSGRLPVDFLQDENRVRQWIESSPDVYCNTTRGEVPEVLNYTKKYFRWQARYTRDELSRIIAEKTGQTIGSVNQIVPLERGVSGRLKKIEIRGSVRTIVIEKELEIRRALSPTYLYSSCFVVDRDGNDFIFKGAGWGHGVGMCQTGAAMMALKGQNYKQILNHYYQNTSIQSLY
ncbi:MAG: SpoIID/LytB domain-containing protein [Candidatus Zhuqueibacterota bacterium]